MKETAGRQLTDEQQRTEVTWEAAYSDQNTEHAFTGVLQRFEKPLGDSNHEVLSVWNPGVCYVLQSFAFAAPTCDAHRELARRHSTYDLVSQRRGLRSALICAHIGRAFFASGAGPNTRYLQTWVST